MIMIEYSLMVKKSWEEMTKAERIKLIVEDSQAYIDLTPPSHFMAVLDGIAKTGPIDKGSLNNESNAAS